MYILQALTVAVAGLVAAANASPAVVKRDLNHATIWSNSDCTGNSEFVYTDFFTLETVYMSKNCIVGIGTPRLCFPGDGIGCLVALARS